MVSTPDGQPIEAAYFWLTGHPVGFLDNAPTYLVFFNLAGGDAQELMGPLELTLLRDLVRGRVHGRPDLYRQRSQLHGEVDLRRARHQDAELFRLHAVVRSDPVAAVRAVHLDLVPVGPAYSLRPSSRLMFSLMKVGAQSSLALKL